MSPFLSGQFRLRSFRRALPGICSFLSPVGPYPGYVFANSTALLVRALANRIDPCSRPNQSTIVSSCGAYQVLDAAVGVSLVDDPEASKYPMPLTATGKYDVEVRNTTRVAGRASCCWLVCCVARVRCSGVVDEWRGSTLARLLPNNLLLFLPVCFSPSKPHVFDPCISIGLAFRAHHWFVGVMVARDGGFLDTHA